MPLPPEATEVQTEAVEPDGKQTAFVIAKRYPDMRTVEHFAAWAHTNNWVEVDPDSEEVARDWISYLLPDGRSVQQVAKHWHDSDRNLSLRVVVQFFDDAHREVVFVSLSPFFLMNDAPLFESDAE